LRVRVGGEERLIAAEDAGRYRDGLGVSPPPGVADAFLTPVDDALVSIVRRWARTRGPFLTAELAARFAIGVSQAALALDRLESDGTLVRGEFRPDGTEREWCDAEVLRQLRQRSLAALRREIEPTDQVALARFLPAWHGVGSDAGGIDRLYEVIEQLQGVAVPASVLERDVLPRRVRGYSPRLLDELCASGEVVWVGAGPLGHDDGRVALLLRSDAHLLVPPAPGAPPEGPEHDRLRAVLGDRGACFFRELAGTDDRETLDALWDLVWAGEVTNDSFAPVRAAIGGGRRSGGSSSAPPSRTRPRGRPRPGSLTVLGPPRAQGRWTLTARELAVADPTLAAHARAAALLERHGVLTREAARGEGLAGGFAGVYPVLRAMEESGRIRRGYFVAGLGGAQFALPGAVDRLRSTRDHDGSALVLAATDPANAYGLSLPWPVKGPQRAAGAYVVTVGGVAVLYLERGGRGLLALQAPDGSWEEQAVAALAGLVAGGQLKRLSLQRFPDELRAPLAAAGFVPTPRGLALYG
jgi:ATP-dependent Lhr-like helicase